MSLDYMCGIAEIALGSDPPMAAYFGLQTQPLSTST
jgi:hypothetical protein